MAAWAHNSQLACQLANSHVKSPANLHTEIKLHMAQNTVLLERLMKLLGLDISEAESYHTQQLQVLTYADVC